MIELGLQRISRLLSATALPWKAIHVAGTNGKGTVCHLTSALLNAYNRSQYREKLQQPPVTHGRFTSPHLVDRWDCIAFSNGAASHHAMDVVPERDFFEEESAVKAFNAQHNINASEFEILTATAFRLFTQRELDVAVVEVGLGGLLDATNILGEPVSGSTETKLIRKRFNPAKWRPKPLITAITQIGLDHRGFLGNTRAEIATQKAGIMKSGVPVAWARDAELDILFETKARELHAPVIRWEEIQPLMTPSAWQDLSPPRRINGELAIISAWTALTNLGRIPFDATQHDETSTTTTTNTKNLRDDLLAEWQTIIQTHTLPGRQETISLAPIMPTSTTTTKTTTTALLDGAHNSDGIHHLAQTVQNTLRTQNKTPTPIIWILALSVSSDRNPTPILQTLLQPGDRVFAVEFGPVDGMGWVQALSAEEIAGVAEEVMKMKKMEMEMEMGSVGGKKDVQIWKRDLEGALRGACEWAGQVGGEVVVCGSLYLVGDVWRLSRERERERER